MTQDTDVEYLIGYEGAGEADDTYIQIYTEWVNQDGTAIPDALADYGFTGRVAYSASAHELQDASQVGTARFSIKPGTHAQVIRLPGQNWGNQHFYVQAFGVPYGEYQDFALGSQSRGLDSDNLSGVAENAYRPKRFVPVKVPVYDEEASLLQEQAFFIYKNEQMGAGVDPDTLDKPEGLYTWISRPEYQFSVYDLSVSQINVQNQQEDGSIESTNILEQDNAVLPLNGTLEILYDLAVGGDKLPTYTSDGSSLILNVAGKEVKMSVTENGSLAFNDLSQISYLGSEDYLMISIYSNQDAANILWEYVANGAIFIEKQDPDYKDLPLKWDDYYPAIGNKTLVIRSADTSDAMIGRTIRATILHPTGDTSVRIRAKGGEVTSATTAEATLVKEGPYLSAKFELMGSNLEPSIPANQNMDNTQIRFELLSANSNTAEETIEGIWYTRNNSNVTLEEVLSGQAVYLYDNSGRENISQANHISLSDDDHKRFDYVQTLLNQIIPRKRLVFANNRSFNYMDEDGIFLGDSQTKIALFKQQFHVNNTRENTVNSFNKLMKDYSLTDSRTEWMNKFVDKILLIGQQLDQSTQPNTADTDDTGLYELYQNAVVPFVDAMIAEADLYAGDAGDSNNTVPTDQWVARTGEDATEHGADMSYCFGCKQTIAQFNSTVVNCRAETAAQIQAREADANQTNYRGHVTVDAEGNCAVATTGGGRWAGLYSSYRGRGEWSVWHAGAENSEGFNPKYWSGIDCSGLVEKAVNAGRDDVQDLAISIPRGPGLTGSQGFFENNAHVYFTNYDTDGEGAHPHEQKLRKGDLVRYNKHVSIVYSDPNSVTGYSYQIVHAYGNHMYDDDKDRDTPPLFSRKVIVTRHDIKTPTGFGRIKLWD